MARKLGCLMLVLFAVTASVAADGGAISGYVKDSTGTPQIGAVVQVFTSAASLGAIVFTDQNGFYAAEHLLPGVYQVKVTAPAFVPSMRENLSLREGARLLVNITLSTLTDAAKVLPARRSSSTEPDDWHWTLRSSANRPILRAVGSSNSGSQDSSSLSNPALAEQAQDRSSTTRLAFIAGSEAEGFGSSGDVTTAFAFEKSMFAGGTLSFNGDIGSSTSGDPAGVLRASYAHDFGDLSRPVVTLTYRRFATPGAAGENSPYAAMEVNTSDHMALSEAIELEYGGALESVEFAKRVNAFRPYGAVLVHLSPDWVVEYRYATAEPDTRTAKGFDSAPADLSESGPKMAVTNGMPDVERAQHQEVSASRRFGKTSVQVACYTDHVHNLVLTGAGDPSNYSDDVLPDLYSGTFSYAYGSDFNTTGARVVVERKILEQLTATFDYSTGGAITAGSAINWQNLAQALATVRQQSVGAKISGYFHATGTRWIASYKWTSGNVISPVDAFNASPGQTDPFLSVFIRQRLPGASFIPAKMDALVDLRNMLAQGYVPIVGPDGRIVYLMQSARSLRAGLAFTF
ncbi:MAG TPA: carboxypeptidase-like regulatory domain-containing protein [Terriglobales bacterium]